MRPNHPVEVGAAALAAGAFVLLPLARGPLVLLAAMVLALVEVRARTVDRRPSIVLLVDGVVTKVPGDGGSVMFGGELVPVERVGGQVRIGSRLLDPGIILTSGAAQLEVLR
jgi:hypothetical protein